MRARNVGLLLALLACGDDDGGDGAGDAGSADTSVADTGVTDTGVSTSACSGEATQKARVACAANALLATLSSSERGSVNLELTDYASRSTWSNLPVMLKPRAGVQLGSLGAASQSATLALLRLALNDSGQSVMTGILRADDYLASMQGGYGSDLYSVAIFGTPSATTDFEVMFGGHHMAYNLSFVGTSFYPFPQHLGCEPKAAFTVAGASYSPLVALGDAMFAAFEGLDAAQRASAYLSGQSFSDVVVNPDLDYGKGADRTSKSAYPTGTNRKGVQVSTLTTAQQALVTTAIEQWVRQYPAEVADALMTAYTGAYADTLFAWAGASSGPDKDASGSYLRIDGPRVWIELAVQSGIVIRGETHYHTIYHDKMYDYGGQL
ncbi:MAG: DUF3500 domain-containing protein [Polyangiales bacterium]